MRAGRCAARWRDSASRARQSCGFSSISRRHSRVNRSGCPGADGQRFEPIEREVGAIGRDLDRASPRSPPPPARCPSATRTSPRFRYAGTARASRSIAPEAPGRLGVVLAAHRLEADLVLEERENRLALRPRVDVGELRQPLPRVVGLGPLMLFLVQLLQVEQRVLVLRIEPQHLVERLERAIDEAAALVVEARGRAARRRAPAGSASAAAAGSGAR